MVSFLVSRFSIMAQTGETVGAVKQGADQVIDFFHTSDKEKDEQGVENIIDQLTKDPSALIDTSSPCGGIDQSCCVGGKSESGSSQSIPIPGVPGSAIPVVGGAIKKLNEKTQSLFDNSTEEIQNDFISGLKCFEGYPKNEEEGNPSTCKCKRDAFSIQELCSYISNKEEQEACKNHTANSAVWTALGPIDFTLKGFVTDTLFRIGIGVAGIVALFCIIYSAFILQISGGSPEKIKKARAQLTACIMGLLLIIFSIFILRVIGVDILNIPGF